MTLPARVDLVEEGDRSRSRKAGAAVLGGLLVVVLPGRPKFDPLDLLVWCVSVFGGLFLGVRALRVAIIGKSLIANS